MLCKYYRLLIKNCRFSVQTTTEKVEHRGLIDGTPINRQWNGSWFIRVAICLVTWLQNGTSRPSRGILWMRCKICPGPFPELQKGCSLLTSPNDPRECISDPDKKDFTLSHILNDSLIRTDCGVQGKQDFPTNGLEVNGHKYSRWSNSPTYESNPDYQSDILIPNLFILGIDIIHYMRVINTDEPY